MKMMGFNQVKFAFENSDLISLGKRDSHLNFWDKLGVWKILQVGWGMEVSDTKMRMRMGEK